MEDYGFGRCVESIGLLRQAQCNQAAVDEGGRCRFHAKTNNGLTDSSLFPTRKGKKVNGVFSYWSVA
jgi:hypothetical protein